MKKERAAEHCGLFIFRVLKNFVVYKSGAGSGKTFTLVKEYLKLALHDPNRLEQNYKRILAITFTNKAAAEMKNRVIESLNEISYAEKNNGMADLLCQELKIDRKSLAQRAGLVLKDILHHYSDFSIGTIDSFTHKVVRTFAQELALPVNFNVELDVQGFYEKVVSQLLAQVGEDQEVSRLLKEFVLNQAEENAAWDPENEINRFTQLLQKEQAPEFLSKLRGSSAEELEAFRKECLEFTRRYKDSLRQKASEAIALIERNGLSDEDFNYKNSGPHRFFYKCASGQVNLEDALGSRITDAVQNGKWAGSGPRKDAVQNLAPQLSTIASELVGLVQKDHKRFALYSMLSRQMYPLMLLKKIEEISREQKQEERMVFLSEFNQNISKLISEEPTPFIYERLGERYRHFLVDEFQDTSTLQWHNLIPLVENSLASGWYNLVVGDGKQSIYRWRNANVRQFASLPAIEATESDPLLQQRAEALRINYVGDELRTNYRSKSTIVDFNNRFFEEMPKKLLATELQAIYTNQSQKTKRDETGYVTILQQAVERDELEASNFSEIRRRIQEALEDGYTHSDICVLCRKNDDGSRVATFLVESGYPVLSSDSLLLKNNVEVNTLVCFLRYYINAEDRVSAAAVLTYLQRCGTVPEADLDSSLKRLTQGIALESLLSQLGLQTETLKAATNLFDLCIAIIELLQLNQRAFPFMRFFLDEVNEFLVTHNSSVMEFLEWWETRSNRSSLVIPGGAKAVKVMSIHSSKGLEFPIVIIPFCNWQVERITQDWAHINDSSVNLPVGVINLSGQASELGFADEVQREKDEQVLDNLNLLYVGFTRAADRLHVISSNTKRSVGLRVSNWIAEYIASQPQSNPELFELGERRPSSTHETAKVTTYDLQPLRFGDTHAAIRIKTDSLTSGSESRLLRDRGLLLHLILSKIGSRQDCEQVIQSTIPRDYSDEDASHLKQLVLQVLENAELRPYFEGSGQHYLEKDLVRANGEVLRPDRVVVLDSETVVIDYKTGQHDLAAHGRQLRQYEQALREMGHKNIKKLIVYTDTAEVMPVI